MTVRRAGCPSTRDPRGAVPRAQPHRGARDAAVARRGGGDAAGGRSAAGTCTAPPGHRTRIPDHSRPTPRGILGRQLRQRRAAVVDAGGPAANRLLRRSHSAAAPGARHAGRAGVPAGDRVRLQRLGHLAGRRSRPVATDARHGTALRAGHRRNDRRTTGLLEGYRRGPAHPGGQPSRTGQLGAGSGGLQRREGARAPRRAQRGHQRLLGVAPQRPVAARDQGLRAALLRSGAGAAPLRRQRLAGGGRSLPLAAGAGARWRGSAPARRAQRRGERGPGTGQRRAELRPGSRRWRKRSVPAEGSGGLLCQS